MILEIDNSIGLVNVLFVIRFIWFEYDRMCCYREGVYYMIFILVVYV